MRYLYIANEMIYEYIVKPHICCQIENNSMIFHVYKMSNVWVVFD